MSKANQEKFLSTSQHFVALSLMCLVTVSCGRLAQSENTSRAGGTTTSRSASADKVVCSEDGQTDCVVSGSFKAVDSTNLIAENIKTGVTIGGVNGNLTTPNPWDLRVGTTVNGVIGKLKVTCRNRVNTKIFNYDNPGTFAIGQTSVTSGTAIDIWDTVDDSPNNMFDEFPVSIVSAWGSNTDCGGVEMTGDDSNVWKDITTTDGTAGSTCVATPSNCTIKNKITGLLWSKLMNGATWDVAWNSCRILNHNGLSGWRLPTQKELMEAYIHGMGPAAVTIGWASKALVKNLIVQSGTNSSAPDASYNYNHWSVHLGNGYINYSFWTKSGSPGQLPFVCVR
jgi:hypothetical protein